MAEIKKGAATIELTAPGTGRGDQSNPTFEYVDKGKQEELRTLAKVNKVNITTHSTPSAWGVAGFGRDGFSKAHQEETLQEVKKAIDFSSSVADGGSVVVHTGEFPRTFTSEEISQGDYQFKQYKDEDKDAMIHLVNKKNGSIISSVKKDEYIYIPVQDMNTDGSLKWLKGENNDDVVDDITHEKIPVYKIDSATQGIEIKQVKFVDFAKEKRLADPQKYKSDDAVARDFFIQQMEARISHDLGQARQYETHYTHATRDREEIIKQLEWMKDLRKAIKTDDEWNDLKPKLLAQVHRFTRQPGSDDPLEAMRLALVENEKEIAYGREISASGRRQALQQLEDYKKHVMPIKDYALGQSAKGYAELAMYAYDRSRTTSKPITLTLENVYPQTYGSTADEIIKIIKDSRQEFARRLVDERKFSKEDAEKKAKDHIQMTFDTGHLNMWRKHFQQKDGETPEQADVRYKKWYLGQVEKLADEGVIGHVHLADNFGYDDAHLVVGQGNVPIKEVMSILDKHGFKNKIAVEGGFNQGREGFHDVWSMMGSPIYGVGAGGPGWQTVHQDRHYGYAAPPMFITGGYAPGNDWKPWSETFLE